MAGDILKDPFERAISYIRISVTDRCDLRCVYCMAENMEFLPKAEILTLQEIARIAKNMVQMGLKKIRLTGGEPLVRRDIMWLCRELSQYYALGLQELTLTTNGTQLHKYANELVDIGVKRINVSIDTLNPELFRKITRWGDLQPILNNIKTAQRAGLNIKINCVALKNVNDTECHNIVQWCGDNGYDISFIEVMPMGDLGNTDRMEQYYPLSLLRTQLNQRFTLTQSDYHTGGPSRYFDCRETGRRIGFITPMTHNFCELCNRVRLSSTGVMFLCLGQDNNYDLRKIIRQSDDDAILQQAIRDAVALKPRGHDFDYVRGQKPVAIARHMNSTGG